MIMAMISRKERASYVARVVRGSSARCEGGWEVCCREEQERNVSWGTFKVLAKAAGAWWVRVYALFTACLSGSMNSSSKGIAHKRVQCLR
jgi:hypothetical protein